MDSQEKERLVAEWEILIGRFSIAMGAVELNVSQLLMLLGASTRGFLNERLGRLSSRLQDLEPSLVNSCLACIDEAKRLKQHRNEVLHSALSIYVWFEGVPINETVRAEQLKDKEPLLGSKIISFDERQSVTDMAMMRALIADAKALNGELNRLLLHQVEFNPGSTV